MGLILLIETATTSCSVALADNGHIMAIREVNERNVHAGVITNFIEEIIAETGYSYHNIDAIAVSCGPGSYTGLRIGVSTAKGLCFALDKPLIAVDTLEAMTYGIISLEKNNLDENLLLCPMIDARRMEVFTAVFNSAAVQITPTSADIIDENSFANFLNEHKILFFGDGAAKCVKVLDKNQNALFSDGFINSAAFLARSAEEKFKAGDFEDIARFEPFYLKDFIAGKKQQ